MNIVMTENGDFVEIQGTAEGNPFSSQNLIELLDLAKNGISELIRMQKQVLGLS